MRPNTNGVAKASDTETNLVLLSFDVWFSICIAIVQLKQTVSNNDNNKFLYITAH